MLIYENVRHLSCLHAFVFLDTLIVPHTASCQEFCSNRSQELPRDYVDSNYDRAGIAFNIRSLCYLDVAARFSYDVKLSFFA